MYEGRQFEIGPKDSIPSSLVDKIFRGRMAIRTGDYDYDRRGTEFSAVRVTEVDGTESYFVVLRNQRGELYHLGVDESKLQLVGDDGRRYSVDQDELRAIVEVAISA